MLVGFNSGQVLIRFSRALFKFKLSFSSSEERGHMVLQSIYMNITATYFAGINGDEWLEIDLIRI